MKLSIAFVGFCIKTGFKTKKQCNKYAGNQLCTVYMPVHKAVKAT